MGKWTWAQIETDDRGQSVIEMALVFGFLLLILMGIADFGRAFNNYIIVTNVSREGARYGSRFPYETDAIIGAARAEAIDSGIDAAAIEVDVVCLDGSAEVTCPGPDHDNTTDNYSIRVTVEYSFDTILAGLIGFDTLTLSNFTEMVIFGPDPNSQDPDP